MRGAQIGVDDPLIGPDLGGGALAEQGAEIEGIDPIAGPEHHVDVVFDEQDADATFGGQAADGLTEPSRLAVVEP